MTVAFTDIAKDISNVRTYLMGIAMMMVVLFHVGIGPFGYFGYWGVDIFLFLSGFGICFSLSKGESLAKFYFKRLLRIMPGALLCGIVFGGVGCVHGDRELAFCGLNLWYIRTILIFYLLSPCIFCGMKRWGAKAIALMIACSEVLAFLFDTSSCFGYCLKETMSWSFSRLPIYILGMALVFCPEKKGKGISLPLLAVAGVGAVIVLGALRLCQMRYGMGFVRLLFMPSFILAPAIMVLGVLSAKWKERVPVCVLKVLQFAGVFSLEIYLLHESLLKCAARLEPFVHSYSLAKLVCVLVSFLLAWVLNKICSRFQTCVLKALP